VNDQNVTPDESYEERIARQAREGVGPAPGAETGAAEPDAEKGAGADYEAKTVPELQDEIRARGVEYRLPVAVSAAHKDELVAALKADDEDEGR